MHTCTCMCSWPSPLCFTLLQHSIIHLLATELLQSTDKLTYRSALYHIAAHSHSMQSNTRRSQLDYVGWHGPPHSKLTTRITLLRLCQHCPTEDMYRVTHWKKNSYNYMHSMLISETRYSRNWTNKKKQLHIPEHFDSWGKPQGII